MHHLHGCIAGRPQVTPKYVHAPRLPWTPDGDTAHTRQYPGVHADRVEQHATVPKRTVDGRLRVSRVLRYSRQVPICNAAAGILRPAMHSAGRQSVGHHVDQHADGQHGEHEERKLEAAEKSPGMPGSTIHSSVDNSRAIHYPHFPKRPPKGKRQRTHRTMKERHGHCCDPANPL